MKQKTNCRYKNRIDVKPEEKGHGWQGGAKIASDEYASVDREVEI